jgi:hypothetical protein
MKSIKILTAISAILPTSVALPEVALAADQTVQACSIESPPAICKGLWALQIDQAVPHGAYVHVPNPGCMNDSSGALQNIVTAAVAAGVPGLAMFSGSISKLATPLVAQELAKHGGFISKHLSPYAKNGALCAPVVGVVPSRRRSRAIA